MRNIKLDSTIVVALIAGGVTLATSLTASLLTNSQSNKKLKAEQDASISNQMKSLKTHLDESRDMYLQKIVDVQGEISELKHKQELNKQALEMQIVTLSDRVEKHNNVVERTYALEKAATLLDEQIKVANHRIGDLERKDDDHK